jgi:DNA-binding PadR family transcriptional regulator
MAKSIESYTPLSETAYYILLSLNEPRHGYGIIKYVEQLTNGRIVLGSGTIYTTLGKMSKARFITVFQDKERKTIYELTSEGKELLRRERARIKMIYRDTLYQEGLFNEESEI